MVGWLVGWYFIAYQPFLFIKYQIMSLCIRVLSELFVDKFIFKRLIWANLFAHSWMVTIYYLILIILFNINYLRWCPFDVVVKALYYGIVRTPVALLRWLSDNYPWERYESPYPPSYRLNSITVVLLEGRLWH